MVPNIARQPLLVAFLTLLLLTGATMFYMPPAALASSADIATNVGSYLTKMQADWPQTMRIICGLLLVISGLVLGRMTVRYDLYSIHTLLAIPIYGICACGLLSGAEYTLQSICTACFIFSLRGFFACFRTGGYGFGDIFKGAFFLGAIPLIYAPAAALVLVIPLVVILFKRSAREVIVAVAGFVLPFLAVSYLNRMAGYSFLAPFESLRNAITTLGGFSPLRLDLLSLVMLIVILILYCCSFLSYYFDLYASGSKSRSILLFSLLLLPITCALLFIPSASPAAAGFVAAPAAIVLPVLLVRLNRWASLSIYLGLLALCIFGFFL